MKRRAFLTGIVKMAAAVALAAHMKFGELVPTPAPLPQDPITQGDMLLKVLSVGPPLLADRSSFVQAVPLDPMTGEPHGFHSFHPQTPFDISFHLDARVEPNDVVRISVLDTIYDTVSIEGPVS